jgi:hypothetical protein
MTGIAFGWIGAKTALASVVQKAGARFGTAGPRTPVARSGRQRQCLELLAGGAKTAELVDSRC